MSKVGSLPKFRYQVSETADRFKIKENARKNQTLNAKIRRIAWEIFSVLVFPVGLARLICYGLKCLSSCIIMPAPIIYNRTKKIEMINKAAQLVKAFNKEPLVHKCSIQQVTLRTADEVNLDCLSLQNLNQKDLPYSDQKWVVFLNGNGGYYENLVDFHVKQVNSTGASVLTGNYRGVGRSLGYPTGAKDMVIDGETMVQYLLHLGVKSENILIHGWSLGGIIASEVAALHQKPGGGTHYLSDRSFADFRSVAKDWTGPVFGPILGSIAAASGWNINAAKNFSKIKGKKIILHHKNDGVISYPVGLYKRIKESQMTEEDRRRKAARTVAKEQASKSGAEYVKEKNYPTDYKPENVIRFRSELLPGEGTKKWTLKCHNNTLDQFPEYYKTYCDAVKSALKIV